MIRFYGSVDGKSWQSINSGLTDEGEAIPLTLSSLENGVISFVDNAYKYIQIQNNEEEVANLVSSYRGTVDKLQNKVSIYQNALKEIQDSCEGNAFTIANIALRESL